MPKDFDQNAEKNMTDKKDIINFLKQSFDDAQKFLSGYGDTDYDTIVELPFGKFSKKQFLMLTAMCMNIWDNRLLMQEQIILYRHGLNKYWNLIFRLNKEKIYKLIKTSDYF